MQPRTRPALAEAQFQTTVRLEKIGTGNHEAHCRCLFVRTSVGSERARANGAATSQSGAVSEGFYPLLRRRPARSGPKDRLPQEPQVPTRACLPRATGCRRCDHRRQRGAAGKDGSEDTGESRGRPCGRSECKGDRTCECAGNADAGKIIRIEHSSSTDTGTEVGSALSALSEQEKTSDGRVDAINFAVAPIGALGKCQTTRAESVWLVDANIADVSAVDSECFLAIERCADQSLAARKSAALSASLVSSGMPAITLSTCSRCSWKRTSSRPARMRPRATLTVSGLTCAPLMRIS